MAFIVFEGLDGAGKSTLIQLLEQELLQRSVSFITTREPGGTELGEKIRQLLLSQGPEVPVPAAELLLYQAARAQHVELKIKPALKQGKWVLCDRFTASTMAFQAGGRGLDRTQIAELNALATGGCQPDLWILLDLSVEESQKRMAGRRQELDRFESEGRLFHQSVRDEYLRLAESEGARWLVLDAALKPEAMFKHLTTTLQERRWLL